MLLAAPGWNRSGEKGLLEILNEAQNLLSRIESNQKMILVNGEFPAITTSSGVFDYFINTTTVPDLPAGDIVWRIGAVLVPIPASAALRSIMNTNYGLGQNIQPPAEKFVFHGKEYFRLTNVATRDRVMTTEAQVKFQIDPGDSTEDYRILMYRDVDQIISESVEPSMPESMHMTLLTVANMIVAAIQNNTWENTMELIERRYIKKARHELDKGEQGQTYYAQRRRI